MRTDINSDSNSSKSQPIKIRRVPGKYEQRVRDFVFSRKGSKIVAWSATALFTLLMAALVAPQSEAAEQVVYLLCSFAVSVSVTITIFAEYAYFEHFPPSATLNIGTTLVLSFFQIGLAATDLAFTKYNKANQVDVSGSEFKSLSTLMLGLWYLVFCGTLICGSILRKFYTQFWSCGQFTVAAKVKAALKAIMVRVMAVVILVGVCGGLLLYFVGRSIVEQGPAAILIVQYVWGMTLLVTLLAYGLIKLPLHLWKKSDVRYNLMNCLSRATQYRYDYREALTRYHGQISLCMAMEQQHSDASNRKLFQKLMGELPQHDVDGQKLYRLKSVGGLELKPGQTCDATLIARLRQGHKLAYFHYARKKLKWTELYHEVERSIVTPVEYTKDDLNKKIDANDRADLADYLQGRESLILQPLPSSRLKVVVYRVLAVLSMLWAVLVITTETTLIAGQRGFEYTAFYQLTTKQASSKLFVFSTSVLFLSGMALSCLFTVFSLRVSDFYQMCPRQTDCVQMAAIMGLTSQIINVICFNYLFICGEITKGIHDEVYRTSFVELYSSMIRTPFFGDWYQVIAPLLILVLVIVFAAIGAFKYNSKTVEALRLYGAKLDTKASGMEGGKSRKSVLVPSFAERILSGERAILREIEMTKAKKEKKRLSVLAGVTMGSFGSDSDFMNSFSPQKQQPRQGKDFQAARRNTVAGNRPPAHNSAKKERALNILQNDAQFMEQFDPRGSSGNLGNPLLGGRARGQDDDFEFNRNERDQYPHLKSAVEELQSAGSYQSQGSQHSKYEIESLDEDLEGEDKVKSQFDSDSSGSEEEEEDTAKHRQRPGSVAPASVLSLFKRGSSVLQGPAHSKSISEVRDKPGADQEKFPRLQRSKTVIVRDNKKNDGKFEMRGWILKKASSSTLGMANWQRRYMYLQNDKLYLFEGDTAKEMEKAKKMINMKNVSCVCFHYDPNAPEKSRKLAKEHNQDKSRFDVYTPGRIFHLKSDQQDSLNSDEWIGLLQKCAAYYNDRYDMRFT